MLGCLSRHVVITLQCRLTTGGSGPHFLGLLVLTGNGIRAYIISSLLKLRLYDLICEQLFLAKKKCTKCEWQKSLTIKQAEMCIPTDRRQLTSATAELMELYCRLWIAVKGFGFRSSDWHVVTVITSSTAHLTLRNVLKSRICNHGSPHQCHHLYLHRMADNPVASPNIYWIFRFTGLYKWLSSDSYWNGFNWPKASTTTKFGF